MITRPIALAMLLALAASLTGPARCASADDLLARMAALNPNLHAFTATMHANVAMKSFPFLSFALVGTYYHQEPDKNKVVFTGGVPAVAQQFDQLYAHIESPSQWRSLYQVTLVSDDGSTTVFRLAPRKRGSVDHIDATVDDRAATVRSMRWNYQNGGFAEMTNRYGRVDGNVLVASQTGRVQEPGYSADITSTIDGYRINPVLPDGIFSDR